VPLGAKLQGISKATLIKTKFNRELRLPAAGRRMKTNGHEYTVVLSVIRS
jgi:hypothetical protein